MALEGGFYRFTRRTQQNMKIEDIGNRKMHKLPFTAYASDIAKFMSSILLFMEAAATFNNKKFY